MPENNMDQAQEKAFALLCQQKNPGLDWTRPVGMLLPHRFDDRPIPDLAEHVLVFDIHKVPSQEEIKEHAQTLDEKKQSLMTVNIFYPDHSVSKPMGDYYTDKNSMDYNIEYLHQALTSHAKRADNLKQFTADAFETAWDHDTATIKAMNAQAKKAKMSA